MRMHPIIKFMSRSINRSAVLGADSYHPMVITPHPHPQHHQTTPSILSFLVFFLAYYLSHHTPFAYVENDTAALAAKSARYGPRRVWPASNKIKADV